MPKIDTGQVQEFEPVPQGTYDAVVSAAEYIEESETSGEPFVKFEFTIDDTEFAGRKVFRNHSCQPQALWALKRTLRALGVDDETLDGTWETEDVLPDIVGNPCRIRVGMREFEGREVNEISRISPSEARV